MSIVLAKMKNTEGGNPSSVYATNEKNNLQIEI
jgi:hypothetical protein